MKRILTLLVSVAILATGCGKTFNGSEISNGDNVSSPLKITGSINQDEDSKLTWSEDDKIPTWEIGEYVFGWYKDRNSTTKQIVLQISEVNEGIATFVAAEGYTLPTEGFPITFGLIYDSKYGKTIPEETVFAENYVSDMSDQSNDASVRTVLTSIAVTEQQPAGGYASELKFDYQMSVIRVKSGKAEFNGTTENRNIVSATGSSFASSSTLNFDGSAFSRTNSDNINTIQLPKTEISDSYKIKYSVFPNTTAGDISVAVADANEHWYKATLGTAADAPKSLKLECGKLYNLTKLYISNYERGQINGHDYVKIAGLKWATMNIGATSAEPGQASFGDLYSWGDIVGASGNSYDPGFTSANYDGKKRGYNPGVAGGKDLTKNIPDYVAEDPGTRKLENYDAAANEWGSTWRMPSKEEFQALYNATNWVKEGSSWSSGVNVNGYYVKDKTTGETLLFFPAAGYSDSTSRTYAGSGGYYWSSSWYSSSYAYDLYFDSSNVYPQDGNRRYRGRSVRPVSE